MDRVQIPKLAMASSACRTQTFCRPGRQHTFCGHLQDVVSFSELFGALGTEKHWSLAERALEQMREKAAKHRAPTYFPCRLCSYTGPMSHAGHHRRCCLRQCSCQCLCARLTMQTGTKLAATCCTNPHNTCGSTVSVRVCVCMHTVHSGKHGFRVCVCVCVCLCMHLCA